ncbi:MAG: hypothetical protein KAX30_04280 [Candidatus Atribacteria bacterium]|nr:hypothetical protein [Candidatus Atribacteria bacterium]
MGVPVTHIDDADTDECLMTGTHKGADGASVLSDLGADFKSCGVHPDLDLLIKNTTDGSEGTITASTEDTVTTTLAGGSNDTWANGDTYVILKTDTEDSIISTHYTDKRFGRKVTNPDQLDDGIFPEDVDLDDEEFSPGFPERGER